MVIVHDLAISMSTLKILVIDLLYFDAGIEIWMVNLYIDHDNRIYELGH